MKFIFEKIQIVDFNENGDLINDTKIFSPDGLKYFDSVTFSNRILLNRWCGSSYNFFSTNGVSTDSFFVPESWYRKTSMDCNILDLKYFWGNDTLKKIKEDNIISGCSPFVYSSLLYEEKKHTPKYQTVFLTRSDLLDKTQLRPSKELCEDLEQTLNDLQLENPIYIAFPKDYAFYYHNLPSLRPHLYSLGGDGFDMDWNDKLIKVIFNSEELYFNMISTPCIYSSFLNKKVKFYESDLQYLPEEHVNGRYASYSLDRSRKDKSWFDFMNYIQDVFENKTDDLDFWIYNFLSLNLVKSPDELREDLLTLNKRYDNMKQDIKIESEDLIFAPVKIETTVGEKNFDLLKDKISKLNVKSNDKINYYYDRL